MTTTTDTGGPAFPRVIEQPNGYKQPVEGMSLRDYFAARALNGLINYSPEPDEHASIAALCYQLADAMLAERSKT